MLIIKNRIVYILLIMTIAVPIKDYVFCNHDIIEPIDQKHNLKREHGTERDKRGEEGTKSGGEKIFRKFCQKIGPGEYNQPVLEKAKILKDKGNQKMLYEQG